VVAGAAAARTQPLGDGRIPRSIATVTARVRSSTSSLTKTFSRCVLTVASLIGS